MTTQPNAQWEAQYNPLDLGEESLMHPFDTVRDLPENTVWSVVEDRQGRLVAVAGRRSNSSCVDYAVTEKPWTTGEERGYWLPLDAEEQLGYIQPRDTKGWITVDCENNGDCDGTPPEEHLFPPEGQRVTFISDEESRLIGGNESHEETFVPVPGGTVATVVIVDPDIHMVGVLIDGRRLWAEPGNLTNTPARTWRKA